MKCLSVSQPFADLIIQGKKTIDLRNWNTKYRGEFLVHSPQKIQKDACKRLRINPAELVTGVIIGKVEIVSVKKYENKTQILKDKKFHFASSGTFKKFGFILDNPKKLRVPVPCKGKLGFFEFHPKKTDENFIKTDVIEEDYRYQWINRH